MYHSVEKPWQEVHPKQHSGLQYRPLLGNLYTAMAAIAAANAPGSRAAPATGKVWRNLIGLCRQDQGLQEAGHVGLEVASHWVDWLAGLHAGL
ncbi:MAG: hypothetical protein FRX49_08498 [Trebouxia sp. A1-2]|nr:MAG: hypothetical protein FRX49_08498 [Trebouxia sp. A1-2]